MLNNTTILVILLVLGLCLIVVALAPPQCHGSLCGISSDPPGHPPG